MFISWPTISVIPIRSPVMYERYKTYLPLCCVILPGLVKVCVNGVESQFIHSYLTVYCFNIYSIFDELSFSHWNSIYFISTLLSFVRCLTRVITMTCHGVMLQKNVTEAMIHCQELWCPSIKYSKICSYIVYEFSLFCRYSDSFLPIL
jgi:hypothetical protein